MESEDIRDRLLWFLLGAAAGAGIALLYAPQSGRQTRRYIRRKAEEGRDAVSDAGKQIVDRSREYYDKGRELAQQAGDLLERGRELAGG